MSSASRVVLCGRPISDKGPLLLGRLLNLNDVQHGVLTLIFEVADDKGLLLLDLKDLRAMRQLLGSTGHRGGHREGLLESAAKSAARSVGSQIGRAILRGVLGSMAIGRRRRADSRTSACRRSHLPPARLCWLPARGGPRQPPVAGSDRASGTDLPQNS